MVILFFGLNRPVERDGFLEEGWVCYMADQVQKLTTGLTASGEEQTNTSGMVFRKRSRLSVALFLIPAIAFQLVWGWIPLVMSIVMGFTNGDILDTPQFVCFQDYYQLLTDPQVFDSFRGTYL